MWGLVGSHQGSDVQKKKKKAGGFWSQDFYSQSLTCVPDFLPQVTTSDLTKSFHTRLFTAQRIPASCP